MNILLQDLTHAVRTVPRNAGYTALPMLTLAIGIGINVVGFGVIHSILLVPLLHPESSCNR
jgi:hypothetical protein